tara:strand:+ start:711 stop:1517 length:807 start_codon:yes stop_codon:yes gene_type:complete
MNNNKDLSFTDLIELIKNHGVKTFFLSLISSLLLVSIFFLIPNKYESSFYIFAKESGSLQNSLASSIIGAELESSEIDFFLPALHSKFLSQKILELDPNDELMPLIIKNIINENQEDSIIRIQKFLKNNIKISSSASTPIISISYRDENKNIALSFLKRVINIGDVYLRDKETKRLNRQIELTDERIRLESNRKLIDFLIQLKMDKLEKLLKIESENNYAFNSLGDEVLIVKNYPSFLLIFPASIFIFFILYFSFFLIKEKTLISKKI